jgi:hypothetical protein
MSRRDGFGSLGGSGLGSGSSPAMVAAQALMLNIATNYFGSGSMFECLTVCFG